ncbi:MAG TPA: GAF domain-containing protein [Planctomycetota bacterium]|nr:GAF domain-containing protein [Planctomycetota bacterium]HRR82979.1 GAF domain-containing protein [Planctomycetota bacterium]HRT94598.1 GAF domain-containing protein [Planctomycetota bacterium]
MPQLRIKNGPAQGKLYPLSSEVVNLGREGPVQILDTAASRQHAEVFSVGDMFFIRDLGSRNGTYLNDERLKKHEEALLRVGDLVRIGSTFIVFEEPGARPADEPQFTSGEEDIGATVELQLDAQTELVEGAAAADQNVHYAVLYDVAKAASSAFDVKTMMKKVCDIALPATGADAAFVFIRERGKLVPVAHSRRVERHELTISSTIVRRALQHRRALLVSDAGTDARFSGASSVVMSGIRSVICAPLLAHEQLEGVLYLHSATPGHVFTDEHLRLATAMALQAAVATEAIQAHEASRRKLLSVFRTLISAHEQASPTASEGHSERVHACAVAICQTIDVPPAEAHLIELAALLHSIGHFGAPEGAFEREENRYDYAVLGAKMLRKIDGMEEVAAAVEAHLERLDGSGGPNHLVGHQIPRAARIVAVADEFDRRLSALGKPPHSSEAVKQVLMGLNAESGQKFDSDAFNGLVVALRTGKLLQV